MNATPLLIAWNAVYGSVPLSAEETLIGRAVVMLPGAMPDVAVAMMTADLEWLAKQPKPTKARHARTWRPDIYAARIARQAMPSQ